MISPSLRLIALPAILGLLAAQTVAVPNTGEPVTRNPVVQTTLEQVTVGTIAEVDAGTGGVVLDAHGNIYNSDFGAILGDPSTAGTRVHKITPQGKVEVFAEGLDGASGSAFDAEGNFYQSNIRGGHITRITPAGEQTKFASEGLQNPVGIVIDKEGTLFVANCGSGSIQKVTRDGASSRLVQSPLLACPNGITQDDTGNLYVANFYNGNVITITQEGEASKLATLPGNNNGHIAFADGSLYVVARSAHQIYQVSLSGESRLIAGSGEKGGEDGAGSDASFCFPNDIAVGRESGTFYVNDVADSSSQGRKLGPSRIRKITIRR